MPAASFRPKLVVLKAALSNQAVSNHGVMLGLQPCSIVVIQLANQLFRTVYTPCQVLKVTRSSTPCQGIAYCLT